MITKTSQIKSQIEQAESLLSQHDNQKLSTVSPAFSAARESFITHINDLKHQLSLAVKEEQSELLQLRLMGDNLNGNVELNVLSNLMNYFNKAISFAADKVKFPTRKNQKFNKNIELKLEGMAYGSCNLFVSGSAQEDLFIFHETVANIFELLNCDLNKSLGPIVQKLGGQGIHNLGLFIRELNKHRIDLDFRLLSLKNSFNWHGGREKLLRLEKIIEAANQHETILKIAGVITLISKYGKLDIESKLADNITKRFEIKVPADLRKQVIEYKINNTVEVELLEKRTFHEVTSEEKFSYSLLNII